MQNGYIILFTKQPKHIYIVVVLHILMKGKVKFEIEGTDMVKKKPSPAGSSSKLYLPKDWAGKEVVVILVG